MANLKGEGFSFRFHVQEGEKVTLTARAGIVQFREIEFAQQNKDGMVQIYLDHRNVISPFGQVSAAQARYFRSYTIAREDECVLFIRPVGSEGLVWIWCQCEDADGDEVWEPHLERESVNVTGFDVEVVPEEADGEGDGDWEPHLHRESGTVAG